MPKRITKPRRITKKVLTQKELITRSRTGTCGICGDEDVPLSLTDDMGAGSYYSHETKGWVDESLDVCFPCADAWLAWLVRVCALLRMVEPKTTRDRLIKLSNRLNAEAYQDEYPELEKWEEKLGLRKAS